MGNNSSNQAKPATRIVYIDEGLRKSVEKYKAEQKVKFAQE